MEWKWKTIIEPFKTKSVEPLGFTTREERLKFYHTLSWDPVVPPDRTKRLREAEDEERVYLGFGRMHRGNP